MPKQQAYVRPMLTHRWQSMLVQRCAYYFKLQKANAGPKNTYDQTTIDHMCIWRCNAFDSRMLSLQRSKERIEIKTSFSSWINNWSSTFWRWHLNWV